MSLCVSIFLLPFKLNGAFQILRCGIAMYQPCALLAVDPNTSPASLKSKPQVLLEVVVICSILEPSGLNLKKA